MCVDLVYIEIYTLVLFSEKVHSMTGMPSHPPRIVGSSPENLMSCETSHLQGKILCKHNRKSMTSLPLKCI